MTESKLRSRISMFIIISYSVLFLSIIIYMILPGFDDEELLLLIGFLSPVTAVYMGAMIKYAVAAKNITDEVKSGINEKKVNKLYVAITNWAIPLHFILLFSLINLKAFNKMTFPQLKILFPVIEAAFGAYIGIITGSLFNINEIPKNNS
jgi:hypothetical protein